MVRLYDISTFAAKCNHYRTCCQFDNKTKFSRVLKSTRLLSHQNVNKLRVSRRLKSPMSLLTFETYQRENIAQSCCWRVATAQKFFNVFWKAGKASDLCLCWCVKTMLLPVTFCWKISSLHGNIKMCAAKNIHEIIISEKKVSVAVESCCSEENYVEFWGNDFLIRKDQSKVINHWFKLCKLFQLERDRKVVKKLLNWRW